MLAQPNVLAAYLYLRMGQDMPEPILDHLGEIDAVADNAAITAWSQATDSFSLNMIYVRRFIEMTEVMLIDLEQLELDPDQPTGPQYMTLVYNAAKAVFDNDKSQLRTYFRWLYLVVLGAEDGPRWGEFITVYGVDNFVALVERRFRNLLNDTT